jgi:hypothetical protein
LRLAAAELRRANNVVLVSVGDVEQVSVTRLADW